MNKRMKAGACLLLGTTLMFTGCSSKPQTGESSTSDSKTDSKGKTTINVFYNSGMGVEGVVESLTEKFMEENPDINVEFVAAAKDYESVIKVKMASKDMPDVFSTHGWAKARYGDFLEDLSTEPWAANVKETLKPMISNEEGKLYVLPLNEDKTGYIYNKTLLDEFGLEVPHTFDELLTACQTIVEKSNGTVTPIHLGGGEAPSVSNFYNYIATPLLISHENSSKEALLDGSFDWSNFSKASEILLELQSKGYLNKDVLTSKGIDTINALAKGEAVFSVSQGVFALNEAKKVNPDFKGGLMPIPSIVEGDEGTFAGGEMLTWGVWNESPQKDAAKRYVAFFAEPENLKVLCDANGMSPGLTGVAVDLGDLTEDFKTYENTRIFPYFDREFLPGGMWGPMGSYGQELLAGGLSIDNYNESLAKEYERLLK